ncbi:translation initiation factor IF-2 [Haloferax mucosum ATCC BAA-1512]|uniref:Translation initiation factor IF-2 n=1 Tax=Haloferax mucosum ATCC BAA-1512 TaxID=662479 RepID=M0IM64_9EURY|nr:NUDIX domain-containing protein [Haloferax mucosum]ELZ96529.1 translation initiation factor IF-2 [Haloferax mucosum ATCC BAA-1512]
MTHVVTAFLRHGGRVLLTRRSDRVGTYRGRWAGVSGYVESDPDDAECDARRELEEEVGVTDATLVRAGRPMTIIDEGREWTVHPFLFDVADRAVEPNQELADVEWVHAPVICERGTVPELWPTYRRVAPTLETVQTDDTHGSAWVSIRALEVLRDAAADAESRAVLVSVARALRDARPSMTAVGTRINRVMAESGRSPDALRRRAEAEIDSAVVADETAAATAATLVRDRGFDRVATLSRSGTVVAALEDARPSVLVAESRPGLEGVTVAESLAKKGFKITLTTDAALPGLVADGAVDAVLVGADTVLSSGDVVNKVGSYPVALAAARAGVPYVAVCARDKIRDDDEFVGEDGGSLYDGEASVTTANPRFEVVPAAFVTGVVTEDGVLDADAVSEVAAEHAELEAWDDDDAGATDR